MPWWVSVGSDHMRHATAVWRAKTDCFLKGLWAWMATESIYNPLLLISWTHVDLIFAFLRFLFCLTNLRRPHKLGDNHISYMLWTTTEGGLSAPWNTVIDVWARLQKLVLLRFHMAGLGSRNEIVSEGDICRDNRWSVCLHTFGRIRKGRKDIF